MFLHLYLNRLKCLIRNKEVVFWTLLFPLLLATLFKLAFSNLQVHEVFKTINIAVVEVSDNPSDITNFQTALDGASSEPSDSKERVPLFKYEILKDEKIAIDRLKENKIVGYYLVGSNNDLGMVIKGNGLYQTIMKSFSDHFKSSVAMVNKIVKSNPGAINDGLISELSQSNNFVREVAPNDTKPDTFFNYFYTLIAMAALYGGFFGSREIKDIQGNQSTVAARVNLSPVSKLKIYSYRYLAALSIHFGEMLILLAYIKFGLNINFGGNSILIVLTTFVACIVGISFGSFISVLIKKGEGVKTATVIGGTMFMSFLSGMMFDKMKYIVSSKAPVLGYINPANLITDAFYSLYFYDTYERFILNISLLVLISLLFSGISLFVVRRQKYASI